ncbi:chorismate mutase, partial [Streptomyces sp. NPDC059538]|uniref:chorismate mutase n=1 Tax=Streptomyces sp. NPDC059538 TaxID=3346860 RepID=UPI0036B3CD7F
MTNPTPESLLQPFRERLEALDQQLAELVAARLAICCEVAEVKRANGIPMMQPNRVAGGGGGGVGVRGGSGAAAGLGERRDDRPGRVRRRAR